jgi:hypothetical protein
VLVAAVLPDWYRTRQHSNRRTAVSASVVTVIPIAVLRGVSSQMLLPLPFAHPYR